MQCQLIWQCSFTLVVHTVEQIENNVLVCNSNFYLVLHSKKVFITASGIGRV